MNDVPAGSPTRGVTGWKATLAIIAAVVALFAVVNVFSEQTAPTIPSPSPPVITSVSPTAR